MKKKWGMVLRACKAAAGSYWKHVAVVVGAAAFALLLWRGPWWLDGAHLRHDNLQPADGVVITGFRASMVAVFGGVIAALTLRHNRKKDERDADIEREGQVTERYIAAVKLLASSLLTERLGGIYALERIMRDSERDHNTVVEVLSAFIREHARKEDAVVNGAEGEGGGDDGGRRERLVGDLQAAMEVLGRRPDRQELEDEGGLERVNLTKVDLRGVELYCHTLKHVDMRDARLDGAQFYMVNFFGAQLQDSCFNGADFCWADLSVCDLSGSDLRNARLHGAQIKHSTLRRVDFSGADMSEVLLENSDLAEANLEAVNFLSTDQVLMARIFRSTKLPVEMCQDARVEARIEECEAERLAWLESRRQAQP